MRSILALALLRAAAARPEASIHKPPTFPEPANLPGQATLPDPILMLDGRRVTSAEMWRNERRPELPQLHDRADPA